MGMLWYSAKELTGDYSLKLDWKMRPATTTPVCSSASPASDDPWSAVNNGYEIQIDATDAADRTTGAVYTFKSADIKPPATPALRPPGEWNTYELRGRRANACQVFLNGSQDQRLHQHATPRGA